MVSALEKCALAHSETSISGVKCTRCGSANPASQPVYLGLEMVLPGAMHEHGQAMTVQIPICPGTCPAFVPIRAHRAHLGDSSEVV